MDPDTDLGRRNQSGSMRDSGPVSGFTKLVFFSPKDGSGLGFEPDSGFRKKRGRILREARTIFQTQNFFTLRLIFVRLFSQLCGSGSGFNRVSGFQCCGSGMFIPDPGYQILFFPPGSRVDKIPDPDPGSRGSKKHRIPYPQYWRILYRTKI